MRKPTILAVDDTPANLVALEAVLDRDFTLLFARSGPEAVALMQQPHDVDVILMDLQMPGMDGFEAAALIKKLPGCEDVPIVFITAVYREDPHVKRGYEAGGVDYFSKPFDPDLLRLKMGIYASFRQKASVLKERERQIKETEELLKAGRKLAGLLESLPVGVLIADGQGRICQANEAVSRICKSVELIQNDEYGTMLGWWGHSGQSLKTPDGPLAGALQGESCHNEVREIRCVDGTTKAVLMSASPLMGLDHQIAGAVIVIQDVSEPKRIQGELEDRIARLVSLGLELEQSARD
ncbi:MAG: response regulator [Deltaproteobacteria bacterium]|nr:response regulator [Deltaproteobacteria bacterium]MDQ3297100.1 response regulator [Myxococcota bacterium]